MGNSSSSHRERTETTVDFGALKPFGTYTGPQDWNHEIVAQLIRDRKLAPFYRPLEDYEDDWDDEQVMAARKALPSETAAAPNGDGPPDGSLQTPSRVTSKSSDRSSRRDGIRIPEAQLYRGAVECPICFLYYPPNINRSRCCDHYICTECFVQIKRADPTPQHLVSEPAACPYCVQDNFGVIYTPPPWRAGIGSDGFPAPELYKVTSASSLNAPRTAGKQRRKSISHTSHEVVTIDQIRPDWEAKLAAVRAAVARRANRRIIMRQVGDRLIPVGISSGRIQVNPDAAADAAAGEGDEASRGSRRRRAHDLSQLLGSMGMAGQDLEELMVMEAMRLSLLEHEQAQRRQQEEERRAGGAASSSAAAPALSSSAPNSSPIAMPRPNRSSQTPTPSAPFGPSSVPSSRSSPAPQQQQQQQLPSPLRPTTFGRPPASGSQSSTPGREPSPLRTARAGVEQDGSSSRRVSNSMMSASVLPSSAAGGVTTQRNETTLQSPFSTRAPIASPNPISSAPPAPPTPVPVPRPSGTLDSIRTDISTASEGSRATFEPLISPDSEEQAGLLSHAAQEAGTNPDESEVSSSTEAAA